MLSITISITSVMKLKFSSQNVLQLLTKTDRVILIVITTHTDIHTDTVSVATNYKVILYYY